MAARLEGNGFDGHGPHRHLGTGRPRILRYEAGLVLDPPLRALSRVSGAADRAIAVRLAALSAGRGHLKLGYSRIADYTRERLDLSERNAFDLCRLGRALGQLPRLDKALT